MVELLEYAEEAGARVVGPNTLGIISPGPRVKVGMAGGPAAECGQGLLSRSGGDHLPQRGDDHGDCQLLTTTGSDRSTCIGIGGDPIIGSNFVDLVPLFEKDPEPAP